MCVEIMSVRFRHLVEGCSFFFSSRRRHTRSKRDWSSDVCSSDLWLLFLPTDILGVLAINSLMAFGLGAIWGVLILTCLLPVNQLLTALPVDVLGSLGELSSPVVSAFALFPLVAIFYQFGWKQSLIAAVVVLMTRVVVVRYFTHRIPEFIEIFIGMVFMFGVAIALYL